MFKRLKQSVETPITQTGFLNMYTDTNTQSEECSKMLLIEAYL